MRKGPSGPFLTYAAFLRLCSDRSLLRKSEVRLKFSKPKSLMAFSKQVFSFSFMSLSPLWHPKIDRCTLLFRYI